MKNIHKYQAAIWPFFPVAILCERSTEIFLTELSLHQSNVSILNVTDTQLWRHKRGLYSQEFWSVRDNLIQVVRRIMETDSTEREKCFLLVIHLLQSHHPPISVFLSFWLRDHPQFESFHHWELCLHLRGLQLWNSFPERFTQIHPWDVGLAGSASVYSSSLIAHELSGLLGHFKQHLRVNHIAVRLESHVGPTR